VVAHRSLDQFDDDRRLGHAARAELLLAAQRLALQPLDVRAREVQGDPDALLFLPDSWPA
jgi:hypothetical protein